MIRGLAAAGLVLLVGVATHVDYHLGRGPEPGLARWRAPSPSPGR